MPGQLQRAITQAKKFLDMGDPHLANFVLRDLPETEGAGLRDLSWAMHQEGCENDDVIYLIEKLEEWENDDA